jgi:hypothetical protein
MLASNDVGLGCSMAEAFTPFLLSFSKVTNAESMPWSFKELSKASSKCNPAVGPTGEN